MTSMKKESPMTSQPSQPKSNESLVLIVGAEGGGITLRGRETAGG
jgi:hypothetical protein